MSKQTCPTCGRWFTVLPNYPRTYCSLACRRGLVPQEEPVDTTEEGLDTEE